MKCININCRKDINNLSDLLECPLCQEYCCSNNCLSVHKSNFHKINNNSDKNLLKSSKNPLLQSAAPSPSPLSKNLFIKNGMILENYIEEPTYYLNNFEFIKNKENLEIIFSGSYSQIFIAKNITNNNIYAIKTIKKNNIENKTLENIYREIQIHSLLIHPNIIRLYYYKDLNDKFVLIMEYAKKGNLHMKIQKEGKLKEKEAFKYFIQISSALYFLHSNGYAHRNLKPENILLDENDNIKLCDFGFCVSLNEGERKTFCGKFEYIAPEMIKEQPYNQNIDIWSLGVILYEMLHGYSPFKYENFNKNNSDDNFKEIYNMGFYKNFEIDEKLNLSIECIDIIKKLLEVDSKKRIKTPEIFLHSWVKKFEVVYKTNNNIFIKDNSSIKENESENDNSRMLYKNSIIQSENDKNNDRENIFLLKSGINSSLVGNSFSQNNNLQIINEEDEKLKDKNNIVNKNNQEGYSIFRQSFLDPTNNNLNAPICINYENNINDNNKNNLKSNIFKSNISNEDDLDYYSKPIEEKKDDLDYYSKPIENKNDDLDYYSKPKEEKKDDLKYNSKPIEEKSEIINEEKDEKKKNVKNERDLIKSNDDILKNNNKKYVRNDNYARNAASLINEANNVDRFIIKKKKVDLINPESFWYKLFKVFRCEKLLIEKENNEK